MDEFELKNQFVIGNSYKVKPMDEVYPVLDDKGNDTGKEETIVSPEREFTVLGFPNDPPGFLEVQRPGREKTNLYFMARTETLELLSSEDIQG